MKLMYQKAKVIMMFDWKPSKTNKQKYKNKNDMQECLYYWGCIFSHLYYYITQSHDTHIDNPDYHSTETRKTDS